MSNTETATVKDFEQTTNQNKRLQLLYRVWQENQELIRFADTKAGGIIMISGFFISAALAAIPVLKDIISSAEETSSTVFFMIVTASCLLSSLFSALKAIKPRALSVETGNVSDIQVIFFEDIALYDNFDDYLYVVNQIDHQQLMSALAAQNHRLSMILHQKYADVSWSFTSLLLTFIAAVMLILITVLV